MASMLLELPLVGGTAATQGKKLLLMEATTATTLSEIAEFVVSQQGGTANIPGESQYGLQHRVWYCATMASYKNSYSESYYLPPSKTHIQSLYLGSNNLGSNNTLVVMLSEGTGTNGSRS